MIPNANGLPPTQQTIVQFQHHPQAQALTGYPPMTMSGIQQRQNQQMSQPQQQIQGGPVAQGANSAPPGPQGSGPGVVLRSQDDAMVGYFFQRPQADMPPAQLFNKHRGPVGDDSVLDQRMVNDVERELQNLTFGEGGREMPKKIWDNDKGGGDAPKAMFAAGQNPWSNREDAWPTNTPGALGVNMAEYVLGGSPVGKDLVQVHPGMKRYPPSGEEVKPAGGGPGADKTTVVVKGPGPQTVQYDGDTANDQEQISDNVPPNGILQNGLEDDKAFSRTPGSCRNSPTEGDLSGQTVIQQQYVDVTQGRDKHQDQLLHQVSVSSHPAAAHTLPPQAHHAHPAAPHHAQISGLQLDTQQFDSSSAAQGPLDPFQVDYANQLMPPSMDSPNFNPEYNQQLLQRQQQQPIAVLTQQQYLAAQQQQLGLSAISSSSPYVINTGAPGATDQYSVGGIPVAAAGPAVVPQYYGVQTPWGIYPAAGILQQGAGPQSGQLTPQQQMMRGQGQRPVTPQGSDALGTPTGSVQPQGVGTPGGQGGYQILTPAYYDANGQLVMSANGRGLGTPVRLVSPAPILVNPAAAAAGQQGYPPTSSLYTPTVSSSVFTPVSNTLQQPPAFNSTSGGVTLGSSAGGPAPGTIGSGLSSQRRDSIGSLDYKQRPQLTQYYGALGQPSTSPAGPMGLVQPSGQSLTPPPSLSGSTTNLALANEWGIGSGRLYSAAPGAEAKYRNSGLANTNGLFGTSLFTPRIFAPKSASLTKEVTGRSRLLEDFRNNRIPNLQLKDLVNHVVEFSQDQHGSRFIQQKLERASPAEKAMVFNEILSAAYSLMTDVFGNYVIQKFFEFGTQEQKQTLAQRVRGHVLHLALQMYGCRVIQKALESIPSDMQVEVVKELDSHVLKCVKDQNGNHVVQKCIECVDPKHLNFIIDAFKGQVFTLSTHPYGCRVIQRILEHCLSEQTNLILDELHSHTERLVQDQYGNYVIQHVLEHGRPDDKSKIVSELRGKVLLLSQHKFASNVVEKCVSFSSRAERALLIEEVCSMNDGEELSGGESPRLIDFEVDFACSMPNPSVAMTTAASLLATSTSANIPVVSFGAAPGPLLHPSELEDRPHSALYTMMKDQFANYVVQKMIDVADAPQRKMLITKIRPHVTTLRKFTYGKHILAKLEKFYMKNNADLGPIGMPPNGALP